MNVEVSFADGIALFVVNGRLDSYGATVLDQEAAGIGERTTHAVIDLSRVDYLSSGGLRSLIRLQKTLRSRKGQVILAGPTANALQVLDAVGFLKEFRTAGGLPDALDVARAEASSRQGAEWHAAGTRRYRAQRQPGAKCVLDLWGSFEKPATDPDRLTAVNLEELEFAFGVAGFGAARSQAASALGEFVAAGNFAGVVPADGHCLPDFILSEKPSESIVYVAAAVALSGGPSILLTPDEKGAVPLAEIVHDAFDLGAGLSDGRPPLLGFVILSETAGFVGSHFETAGGIGSPGIAVKQVKSAEAALIVGVAADGEAAGASTDPAVRSLAEELGRYPIGRGRSFHGHAVLLPSSKERQPEMDPRAHLRALADLESLQEVAHVEPETRLAGARVWLYVPKSVRSGEEKRLQVEVNGAGADFPEELDVIVRRLYGDAGRVVLTPLHGGFMSRTFRVASYDREGRSLLPTVLKAGSLELTRREADAYRRHVEKFILNNSVTIMGTASYGNWAALRYNFVGITGPESKLVWLEDLYARLPAERVLSLFDTIYTRILRPWYGQPKWETLQPYVEHDPFRLFPNILEDAASELGISADAATIACPELERELLNPFYFLKHEYPRRRSRGHPWYRSIIHGDLNMKNILLDEQENVYIIDFSESRIGNAVSDFARLEPIVKFQMTRLDDDGDFSKLVEFEAGLAQPARLGDKPPFTYRGSDPMVEKAYRAICRMREYADTVTLFESDIVPYLLALLEWTFPVASYRGFPLERKKLAAYSAALICERIAALEVG